MTRAFKLILIGFVVGFVAIVYYKIGYTDAAIKKPTPIFKAFNKNEQINSSGGKQKILFELGEVTNVIIGGHGDVRNPIQQPITVTNHFDMRGTNEVRMIDMMAETLATLGIVKDEYTVRQLVLARVKADWSKTPPGPNWQDSTIWQKDSADMLKRKISRLLGTTDQLTLQRVLECPIGPTVPPMEDYEVGTDK